MTQDEALTILKCGTSAYITGPAGSGKTHVINTYIDYLREQGVRVAVTASTGIAATHIGGVTIHSWSGIGIKDALSNKEIDDLTKKRHLIKNFKGTQTLIIDEISMLHAGQLDLIDRVCRAFKQSDKPFGGMQVILSGDFFQLPPITRAGQSRGFAYEGTAWQALNPTICYLAEQHRHSDDTLTTLLEEMRRGEVSETSLEALRGRYRGERGRSEHGTKLYTHNVDVDRINEQELEKIPGKIYRYGMRSSGNKKLAESLIKSCLAPEELCLKKGATVMFVKNNFEAGYVNGTLGTVSDFDEGGYPIVTTSDGRAIAVEREGWKIDDDGATKAEVRQLPLRLAWAITIHKSQGMSLDGAQIDLSKSFVAGMGYVALSRVRTLGGIVLVGMSPQALEMNENIRAFDQSLRDASRMACEELGQCSAEDIASWQKTFVGDSQYTEPPKRSTYDETLELLRQQIPLRDVINQRGLTEGTILSHLEKLQERGEGEAFAYLRETIPNDVFEKIKDAFAASEEGRLTPVYEALDGNYAFEDLRFVRLFLDTS